MDVLVVGAGAVGRWIGGTVEDAVSFTDRDPAVARAAAEAVGGRAIDRDHGEVFDVVCIAVPISAVEEAIESHSPDARHALVDFAGVMTEPLAAMERHASDLERASIHPLFAPGRGPGRVAVVRAADGPVVDAVIEAIDRDHDVFETTAADHDRAMSTVQARAHAAVLAFGLAADSVPEQFHTPVSAALTDLLDRVTDGDARTYAEIQAAFEGADDVAVAARRLADADEATFAQLYRDARR